MNNETAKSKVQEILNSSEKLAKWASMNDVGVGIAKLILVNLLEKPEVSKEAEKYIWEQSDANTKSYVAGEEKGYKRGHGVGFGKGLALGVLSCVAMGAAIAVKGATNGAIDFTKIVPKKH